MKKFYMNPELVVIALSQSDIVTASQGDYSEDTNQPASGDKIWGDISDFINVK